MDPVPTDGESGYSVLHNNPLLYNAKNGDNPGALTLPLWVQVGHELIEGLSALRNGTVVVGKVATGTVLGTVVLVFTPNTAYAPGPNAYLNLPNKGNGVMNDNYKGGKVNNGVVHGPSVVTHEHVAKNSAMQRAIANNGIAKPHGGKAHNHAIDVRVKALSKDDEVTNIRKNQRQVDVLGNTVGRNRPDIQYDKNGEHYNVEYDNVVNNSIEHGKTLKRNDPNANNELNLLKK